MPPSEFWSEAMSREQLPLATPRSKATLEAHSLSFIERLYPEVLVAPQPVPVADFLEIKIPQNLPVAFDIATLPYPTEAVTTPDSGDFEARVIFDPRIYDNLMDGNGRARFTAAHEAAHALYHRNEIRAALPHGAHRGLYRKTDIPYYKNPEWQADKFAATFLMPEPAVRVAVQQFGPNVRTLARTFQVSEMAMEFRLGELGFR